MRSRLLNATVLLLLVALVPAADAATFVPARDVTEESGIDFVHAPPRSGQTAFHESSVGGACWGDFDRDGWMDLYVTDQLGPEGAEGGSRLYRNAGGRFEDATAAQGVGRVGVSAGCAWGDYDNDGWPDLFVTFVVTDESTQGNVLFRNLGNARGFEDVTAAAGVGSDPLDPDSPSACAPEVEREDGTTVRRCWSTGAAWLDFDLDGDLDLYVAFYAEFPAGSCTVVYRTANPVLCVGQTNRLYRNEANGAFTDVAREAGVLHNGQGTRGRSLGVIASDVDRDGWPDLYVANDKDASALYLNNRDGTFTNVASALGVDNHGPLVERRAEHRAGMGVDATDFDNDGRVDLLSTHLVNEYDGIYRWNGTRWSDVAAEVGVGAFVAGEPSRWGGGFVDFDLDGWKDLLLVTGEPNTARPGPIHLFLQRDGRFERLEAGAWPLGAEDFRNQRAAAFADYDNDGDMDVYVSTLTPRDGDLAVPRLLRFDYAGSDAPENPARDHRWLRVELVGTDSARDPVGARVKVVTEDGRTQWMWRASGGSYLGSNDPRLLFGLGNATRGTLEVTWPGGRVGPPVPFDLEDARGLTIVRVEPNLRPPPAVQWAGPGVARDGAGATLSWTPSFASDFVAYRVYVGDDEGFHPSRAVVHEVTDRARTTLHLPEVKPTAAFRITVVDVEGHESRLGPEASVKAGGAALPGPGLAVLLLAGLAAAAYRARR